MPLKRDPKEIQRIMGMMAEAVALAGIQNNLQKLKEGKLQGLHILSIARDMEQSLLETKWAELLKSKDMEYQNLLRAIESQTHSHKRKLEEKIEEVKSRP
ncbi:MAG: hypothetical protein AMJ94_13800 [Deltaproteobacteria bacterium SM23_61]|nr:MAG: hypothetical protein AMJ94_13800 [Deltaproteobacteria bacterium SM23_61]